MEFPNCYAIYSSMAFEIIVGILLGPMEALKILFSLVVDALRVFLGDLREIWSTPFVRLWRWLLDSMAMVFVPREKRKGKR